MTKYAFTCYPSVDNFSGEVEADTKEEALAEAQEQSNNNYGFVVLDSDLTEVVE